MSFMTNSFRGLAAGCVVCIAILAGCADDDSPVFPDQSDIPEEELPQAPILEADLNSLFFDFEVDSTALTLKNAGEDSLRWYASTGREWCFIEDQWGVLEGGESRILTVRAVRTGLRTGLFETSLVLETDMDQTIRVPVSLRNYNENIFLLDLFPGGAEYDRQLDRIVLVDNNPNPSPNSHYLHVIDPWGHAAEKVPLIRDANSLSLAPGGGTVAVGHNGLVSYVDIRSMAVLLEVSLAYDIGDILLADNGWIYAFPLGNDLHKIQCIEIATGIVQNHLGGGYARDVTDVRIHPYGESFFTSTDSGIRKYDIREGIAEEVPLSIVGEDYRYSWGLWFADDGRKMILNRGDVFSTTEDDPQVLRFMTTLDLGTYFIDELLWVDTVPGSENIVGTSQTAWRVFDEDTLELLAARTLPGLRGGDGILPSRSRWGFCKSTGDSAVFIIEDLTDNRGWATAAVSLEAE